MSAFRRRPELLGAMRFAEVLPGDFLRSILIEAAPRYWNVISEDGYAQSILDGCFLTVIRWADWQEAVALAPPAPSLADDWVTCIQTGDSEFGLVLPQDSRRQTTVSLFKDIDGRAQVVKFSARRSADELVTLSVASGHCGFPTSGRCDPGQCGSCIVRLREIGEPGLVCWCPH